MSARTPDEVDKLIGLQIRQLRRSKSMTQKELGVHLDLTFQQIQKYEKGVNRIGAARLNQIAEILGCNIEHFFENIEQKATLADEDVHIRSGPSESLADDFLEQSIQLQREFHKIADARTRIQIIDIVKSLATSTS